MLCSRLLRKEQKQGPIFQAFENAFKRLEETYSRYLDLALGLRWVTVGLAGLLFFFVLALVPFVPY